MASSALPAIVGKYIRETAPSALEPYLAATGLQTRDLDNESIPSLNQLVSGVLSNSSSTRPCDNSPQSSITRALETRIPEGFKLDTIESTYQGISVGNLLGVWAQRVGRRTFDTRTASYQARYPERLLITSVDKTLKLVDPQTGDVETIIEPHKAAILAAQVHPDYPRYLLTGSMDGTAILTDMITNQPVQTFCHSKFCHLVAFSPTGHYIATAGHDKRIVIYQTSQDHAEPNSDDLELLDHGDEWNLATEPSLRYQPVWSIETQTNPEAMVFTDTHLIYTLRNSPLLHFLSLTPNNNAAGGNEWTTTTKSFNEHPGDTHVSFSVLHLALHPTRNLVACLTGDPATVGGAERILIYSTEVDGKRNDDLADLLNQRLGVTTVGKQPIGGTKAVETGVDKRLACLWTGEIGDPYVLPRMSWLPDGSGLVTTTTTGHLVLIDLSGNIKAKLRVHGEATTVGGKQASALVKDVTVLGDPARPDEWRVVSVGYDGRVQVSK